MSEWSGPFYTETDSLFFPFYTECIIIIRRFKRAMNKSMIWIAIIAMMLLLSSGCNTWTYLRRQTIRPGMTFTQVYHFMGKPVVGFGLPQKGTGKSWIYYRIPFNRYLVVNFEDDKVSNPPISIESRNILVY